MFACPVPSLPLTRLALARLHWITDLALALPNATLLLTPELEMRNLNPRQGDGNNLLPLSGKQVSVGAEPTAFLLAFATTDFAEPV